MIVPTDNGAIAQQTADSHDAEKNIFSGESRGDERRADDGERLDHLELVAGGEDQRGRGIGAVCNRL